MKSIIMPIAGKSSRFTGDPKWTLRGPHGFLMPVLAVNNIVGFYDRVVVVMLEEHFDKYYSSYALLRQQFNDLHSINPFVILIKNSDSQPSTVWQGIDKASSTVPIEGSILIKDCDNYWELQSAPEGNFVVYSRLEDYPEVTAQNKSYITTDSMGNVSNVVEKKVISNTFCVGGYGFEDTEAFKKAYLQTSVLSAQEIHVSHLIYSGMLHMNQRYSSVECSNFEDWGTEADWNKYNLSMPHISTRKK